MCGEPRRHSDSGDIVPKRFRETPQEKIIQNMIQPIYLYGSEVLRAKAEDIDLNDKEYISNLVKDLKETLAHADGCGLAAPQIGVSKRALIVDGTGMVDVYDYLKDFKRTMINPVIIEESEDENVYSEGCLSIPGIYGDVKRPASMTVE